MGDNANRAIYAKDCLDVLNDREAFPDASVDLIYLDPPFNSNATYNLPFKDKYKNDCKPVEAFKDTWSWAEQEGEHLARLQESPDPKDNLLADIVKLARRVFAEKPNAATSPAAYMVNMAVRLRNMRRVLKPTGSIYLHCDPTASHYLKMLMDAIFGQAQFRNEIVWCYTGPGSPSMRQFNRKHDTIFWYSVGEAWTFNRDDVRVPHADGGPHTGGFQSDSVDAMDSDAAEAYGAKGKVPETWWKQEKGNGLCIVARSKSENLGYPTQKPLALLERIIKASSNEGDLVLDPFCGCGTTVHAAESLKRRWVGIDIAQFSAGLIRNRLADNFHHLGKTDISIVGTPLTVDQARELARDKPFEFEKWVCGEVGARGLHHNPGQRGRDGGVDGVIRFYYTEGGLGSKATAEQAVIQVKGGKVTPDAVRGLSTSVRESGSKCGVMVCFERYKRTVENNREKRRLEGGWMDRPFNFIQCLTIEEMLAGKRPDLPGARAA